MSDVLYNMDIPNARLSKSGCKKVTRRLRIPGCGKMWCGSAQAHVFRRRERALLVLKYEYVVASNLQYFAGKERSEKLKLIPVLIDDAVGISATSCRPFGFCGGLSDHRERSVRDA